MGIPQEIPKQAQAHEGTFDLQDGSRVSFAIKTDGMLAPVVLTLAAYKPDGTPMNSLKTDTALYFDAEGNITGRAPHNSHTNVRKLKGLYAESLHGVLSEAERRLIVGFFLPGDFGVRRQRTITKDKLERVFIDGIL